MIAEGNLAWGEHSVGRSSDAVARFRTLLPRADAALPGHWLAANWRGRLGICLAALGKHGEALEFLEQGHRVLLETLGAESARTQTIAVALRSVRAALEADVAPGDS